MAEETPQTGADDEKTAATDETAEKTEASENAEATKTQEKTSKGRSTASRRKTVKARTGAGTRRTARRTGTDTDEAAKTERSTTRTKRRHSTKTDADAAPAPEPEEDGDAARPRERSKREDTDMHERTATAEILNPVRLVPLAWRLGGLLVFGFVAYMILMVLYLLAALQFLVMLVRDSGNEEIGRIMDWLMAWLRQIVDYFAGRTQAREMPFPFTPLSPEVESD